MNLGTDATTKATFSTTLNLAFSLSSLPLLLASLWDDCRRPSVYEWAVVAIMVDVVCANDAGRGMMGVLFHTHSRGIPSGLEPASPTWLQHKDLTS